MINKGVIHRHYLTVALTFFQQSTTSHMHQSAFFYFD